MFKLREKKEILNSLKNEYYKAELSMLDLFSQTMTKDDLKELIRYNNYGVKLSLNKPEMSKELAQAIEEKFIETLRVITSSELLELEKIVLYNMSFVDLDSDFEMFRLKNKYSLKGFIYFLDSKEHYPEKILVVPKEIINILITNIDKFEYDEPYKREEVITIITGLVNLYGVYEISHLKFMLDKFGIENIDDNFIEECFVNSNILSKEFNKFNEYIVHKASMIDMSCVEIIKSTKFKEYYIPSYDEVMNYVDNGMDTTRKSYIEMFDYLKKLTKNSYFDVNDVAFMIYDLCIMDANIHDIIEMINSSEVAYDTENQFKELLTLVMNLSSDSRKWINRGFTPNELLKHNADNIIKLNKEKKKVGRNDPCPCGSGKKYKKCCMLNNN